MQVCWPLEVWRGYVNVWDCDEMGHMNMRFYLDRAQDGLAMLAASLGQAGAFTEHATSTLIVRAHHVRFLREAPVGSQLHMTAGVLELGECDARVVQMLHHSIDGEPCAAITAWVRHATPEGRAFPWSLRAREAADRLMTQTPPEAAPRSLSPEPLPVTPEAAADPRLARVGLGPLADRDCDVFGYMQPQAALGRMSDGTAMLMREVQAAQTRRHPGVRLGSAALEYRLDYLRRPRAGDLIEVRSRIAKVGERALEVEHWLVDPLSREPWVRAQGVGASFDLDQRRILPLDEAITAAAR